MKESYLPTCQALQLIPELALEQVHNQTTIPSKVTLPLLFARNLRRQIFKLCLAFRSHVHWRFLSDSVQVFMQAVKEELEKLLRVVLFGSLELGGILANRPLK